MTTSFDIYIERLIRTKAASALPRNMGREFSIKRKMQPTLNRLFCGISEVLMIEVFASNITREKSFRFSCVQSCEQLHQVTKRVCQNPQSFVRNSSSRRVQQEPEQLFVFPFSFCLAFVLITCAGVLVLKKRCP